MKKQKNIIKSILLIVITMFLITINVFATVGTDNSNMILSMPIIKIIIVIVAGIIIVTLLYNVSQDTTSNTKELIKQMEKSENNKKYNNEYNNKKKNNKIDKKIIEKANEPEKPKIREGYIRESRLDENLLEEITNLYNEDNKKDSNNINNKIDKNVNKEEKEEIIGDKAIEIEKGKKSKEDKKDKLTEDFLNNLETTMREGK